MLRFAQHDTQKPAMRQHIGATTQTNDRKTPTGADDDEVGVVASCSSDVTHAALYTICVRVERHKRTNKR